MSEKPSSFFTGTILDFSKRQNVLFWISQAAVVLSTIIGVYLATAEGLKSAFEFHNITNLEKNFYTLSALHDEIDSNNKAITDFTDKLLNKDESGKVVSTNSALVPELNWYVWTTMSNVTETLELPVEILRDTNRYYLEMTDLLESFNNSGGRDKLRYGINIEKYAMDTDQQLLVRISDQMALYKDRLSQYKDLGQY